MQKDTENTAGTLNISEDATVAFFKISFLLK